MTKPIVIGYDHSPSSELALKWGLKAAADRKAPVTIVTMWATPGLPMGVGMETEPGPSLEEHIEQEAELALKVGLERAASLEPSVEVKGDVIAGPPAKTLVDLSPDAAMVVVGTHDKQGIVGVLLGSVSRQVMAHAKCPVVVVRAPADPSSKDIVVGIDGSHPSMAALEWAFDHASRTSQSLKVVNAWEMPAVLSPTATPTFSGPEVLHDFKAVAERRSAEVLAGFRQQFPDVRVTSEPMQGGAGRRLTEASDHAALVVVGSRGHGGFVGLMIGSVSHYVGHHAHCPVVVVH